MPIFAGNNRMAAKENLDGKKRISVDISDEEYKKAMIYAVNKGVKLKHLLEQLVKKEIAKFK